MAGRSRALEGGPTAQSEDILDRWCGPRGGSGVVLTTFRLANMAQPHGIAGNRLVPTTLTFDDPAVADELSGPIVFNQTHPVYGASDVLDTSVEMAFSRLLLPDLAIAVDSDWTRHESEAEESTVTGVGATHFSLKDQLYRNDAHETLVAASLSWGIGGVGNPDLHAHAYNTLEPGIFFGRGFGGLPDRLSWFRPIAIAVATSDCGIKRIFG
jgi:hypothetical protein